METNHYYFYSANILNNLDISHMSGIVTMSTADAGGACDYIFKHLLEEYNITSRDVLLQQFNKV